MATSVDVWFCQYWAAHWLQLTSSTIALQDMVLADLIMQTDLQIIFQYSISQLSSTVYIRKRACFITYLEENFWMFFLLLEIHCQESDKVLLHCIGSLVPLLTENKVYNTTPSDLFSISNRVWCRFGKKKFHHITPTKMTYSLV